MVATLRVERMLLPGRVYTLYPIRPDGPVPCSNLQLSSTHARGCTIAIHLLRPRAGYTGHEPRASRLFISEYRIQNTFLKVNKDTRD